MSYSVVVVSHSRKIAEGLEELIRQVASDVDLHVTGGTEDGEIGTSFDQTQSVIEACEHDHVLAFFDLGSARMNLDLAVDFSEKSITVYEVPVVEGAYTACALLQANASIEAINEQLQSLEITK